MTALLTTEDTLILDEMLSHEAKCQARHDRATIPPCSGEVVFAAFTAHVNRRVLVCSAAGHYALERINSGAVCTCRNLCSLCWTVTPS